MFFRDKLLFFTCTICFLRKLHYGYCVQDYIKNVQNSSSKWDEYEVRLCDFTKFFSISNSLVLTWYLWHLQNYFWLLVSIEFFEIWQTSYNSKLKHHGAHLIPNETANKKLKRMIKHNYVLGIWNTKTSFANRYSIYSLYQSWIRSTCSKKY